MAGLQNFIASMSKSKGFARTSKYAVVITPPSSLVQLGNLRNTTTIAAVSYTHLTLPTNREV